MTDEQRWRELGVNLHEQMDAAMSEAGVSEADHPDDDAHNIAVGRAIDIIASGEAMGGVRFYNRWADGAGYPGVSLVSSSDPLQVDIGTAIGGMVAELKDGGITILSVGDWVRPGYVRASPSYRTPTALWGKAIFPAKLDPPAGGS